MYRVVIEIPFNGVSRLFEFDTCRPPKIDRAARFAEQPIQSGVTVADHMWVQAESLDLQGTFGLSGRWRTEVKDFYTTEYIVGSDLTLAEWIKANGLILGSDRLANVELLFKWVQKSGTKCSLKFMESDTQTTRFVEHENMVLESYSFQENYDSLEFNFHFKEVLEVDMSEFVALVDELLPTLTIAPTKSVGQVLQDTSSLTASVLEMLINQGYIADKDGYLMYKYGNAKTGEIWGSIGKLAIIDAIIGGLIVIAANGGFSALIGAAIGASIVAAGGSAAVWGTGLAGATVVSTAGLIVLVVAAVASVILGTRAVIKKQQARARLKKGFNLIIDYGKYYTKDGTIDIPTDNPPKINDVDIARLEKLLNNARDAVNKASDNVTLYIITTDDTDNSSRQFAIPLGTSILNITIDACEARDGAPFNMTITEYQSTLKSSNVAVDTTGWQAITNLADAETSQAVKSVGDNHLFVVAPVLAGCSQQDETTLKNKLSSYMLMTVKGPIENYVKAISDAVVQTLENAGFDGK